VIRRGESLLARPARACHDGSGCGNGRLCRGVHFPGERVLHLQAPRAAEEDVRDERAPWAGGPKPKLATYDEALRGRVASELDSTLAELQAWFMAEHCLKVSVGRLWKRLPHLGLTDQKKSLRATEQDRADIAKAREEWRASQPELIPERLVFIDETCAKINMVRPYGRAPRGQRHVAPVPHGHWMTTTFLVAFRNDEITARCVFNGPMDERVS
jgi:hypothetical protein